MNILLNTYILNIINLLYYYFIIVIIHNIYNTVINNDSKLSFVKYSQIYLQLTNSFLHMINVV